SNHPEVNRILGKISSESELSQLDFEKPQECIQLLFDVVFARAPSQEESDTFVAHLASHSDNPESALQQLLWAMLTSAEFHFNH
ncbi:MAG: hypothetical protein AAF483_27785, partial [Planctomycetota bacterium]